MIPSDAWISTYRSLYLLKSRECEVAEAKSPFPPLKEQKQRKQCVETATLERMEIGCDGFLEYYGIQKLSLKPFGGPPLSRYSRH